MPFDPQVNIHDPIDRNPMIGHPYCVRKLADTLARIKKNENFYNDRYMQDKTVIQRLIYAYNYDYIDVSDNREYLNFINYVPYKDFSATLTRRGERYLMDQLTFKQLWASYTNVIGLGF